MTSNANSNNRSTNPQTSSASVTKTTTTSERLAAAQQAAPVVASHSEPTELQIFLLFVQRLRTFGAVCKGQLLINGIANTLSLILPTAVYAKTRSALQQLCPPIQLPFALGAIAHNNNKDDDDNVAATTLNHNSRSQASMPKAARSKNTSPSPHRDAAGAQSNTKMLDKSIKMTGFKPPMPECWGHRGASAAFPENTIASFDRAIRDGAEGLESDVHVTADDVVIMFHDPSLERTTDGKGFIREQPWVGGIEHARTKAQPSQQIPTFAQVCDLLMRPDNQHVKLNIDIKPENDPDRLFRLMKKTIESYDDYATVLAPRMILGLWHPVFLRAALEHVPSMRRVHIGGSPMLARTYFWRHCDGFSMWFPSLVSTEGQNFMQQAQREGKDVFVWTVNRRDEMIEATRWGVKAILTDKTDLLRDVRKEMTSDYSNTRSDQVGFFFRWATWRYYQLPQLVIQSIWISELEKRAGISFKRAYKADSLATLENPINPAIVTAASVENSPASMATLNDQEVPPMHVGGKDNAVAPSALSAAPVVAATA